MAVSMTADQFHELTNFKLDQLWHRLDHLRHRMNIEATREGGDHNRAGPGGPGGH